ncbi:MULTISPECIES: hypothetical protein [unclassified Streptomyces]|uniref:hypothetical protein n=1 Tax=unclassified Streptomyces TaxID=2593676 RepID=UPI00381AF6C9
MGGAGVERARVVGVTGPGGPGSGYAVGGRLVLTSAHVVARAGERVQVFRPGGAGRVGGRVVWCGTPGGRDDAALVLLDDDPAWQVPGAVVGWGRMATDRPGTACQTWGLPDVAQRPGQPVEAAQLKGAINPGTGLIGNQYVMDLLQHPRSGRSRAPRRGAGCRERPCSATGCWPGWWPPTVRIPGTGS